MPLENTNLIPPKIGQQFPIFPHLLQFVRVTYAPTGTTSGGFQVYPCVVQQWDGGKFRDREQAYVIGANKEVLGPGDYMVRLIGAWPLADPGGLPLFATYCCVGGSSLSSQPSASLLPSAVSSLRQSSLAAKPSLLSSISSSPGAAVSAKSSAMAKSSAAIASSTGSSSAASRASVSAISSSPAPPRFQAPCCSSGVTIPATLYLTFTGCSIEASCFSGVSIRLDWSATPFDPGSILPSYDNAWQSASGQILCTVDPVGLHPGRWFFLDEGAGETAVRFQSDDQVLICNLSNSCDSAIFTCAPWSLVSTTGTFPLCGASGLAGCTVHVTT